MNREEALEAVRKKMQEKKGRKVDPTRLTIPNAKPKDVFKYKFYVLPPLQAGDTCATGKASKTMDLWNTPVGTHWINRRPYECPRIHDGERCAFCQLGFDLLSETDDKKMRSQIARSYLSAAYYPVNVWFPSYASTPEELRDKVLWFALPKTVYDIMEATIMRDENADTEDPQAYGLFYLPEEAYVFQLEVKNQGGFNDYKSSKFLPNTRGPMVKSGNGQLDSATMQKILARRHDIFTKYAARDAETLERLAKQVMREESKPEIVGDRPTLPDATQEDVEELVENVEMAPEVETTETTEGLLQEPEEVVKSTSTPVKTSATASSISKTAVTTKVAKMEPVTDPDDEDLAKLLRDIHTTKSTKHSN